MTLRAQLPVHSPLPLAALAAGVRHSLRPAGAAARLESLLRGEFGSAAVMLTDSGTAALALALQLAGRERPGPVALPAFCCYDVATAADIAAVPFMLYDVDPGTLGPDPDSLRRALTAGARSVVVAHLFGVPVDMSAVGALAREVGAVVIEDAAQAVGARLGGRPAGALGRFGVLSFGRGKGITGGGGGALLGNERDTAESLRILDGNLASGGWGARNLITSGAQWLLARPAIYGLPSSLPFLRLGQTVYRPPHAPARPSAVSLGILTHTYAASGEESAVRKAHARRLLDAVQGSPVLRGYGAPPGMEAGYLRLPVHAAASVGAAVRSADARRLGVWPSYPLALVDLPGFSERRVEVSQNYRGARELARGLVTLPTHSRLGPDDLRALERWIAALG